MIKSTTNLLASNSPQKLIDFFSICTSTADLIKKLEENPSQMGSFIEHMETKGNEPLTQSFKSYINNPDNPEVKKVETALRNRELLNREKDTDFSLTVEGKTFNAHKAILSFEAPYFTTLRGYKDKQKPIVGYKELTTAAFVMKEMGISPEAYQSVLDYLYLSDKARKEFLANVDKSKLVHMAKLADFWGVDELKTACDEELCNAIGEFSIETEGLEEWLAAEPPEKKEREVWLAKAPFPPKFAQLLALLKRVAGKSELEPLIDHVQTPKGAAELAAKCTPEERTLLSTLKTEFGKACQIPPGIFGKAEWEKTFPVTIEEVPPLPPNIHAILEMEDPCEPGKKLKETCVLFLRPESVVLQEESGDKEVELNFDGVEELAKKATDSSRRTSYRTFDELRQQMNHMPIAKAAWVLMRKEVVLKTRNEPFDIQTGKLKGQFRVPKVMDAILLNILMFASEGKYLYGQAPWTYTRCEEMYGRWQIVVGGFGPSGLLVRSYFGIEDSGLSASWEF